MRIQVGPQSQNEKKGSAPFGLVFTGFISGRDFFVAFRARLACAVAASAAAFLGGCSVALTDMSAKDEDSTSSIARPQKSLSSRLEPEDWRRAQASLGVALDPQANGAAAKWDNPQTGFSGSFQPVGLPYPRDGQVCRAFVAKVSAGKTADDLQGVACKEGAGDWNIRDVRPFKRT